MDVRRHLRYIVAILLTSASPLVSADPPAGPRFLELGHLVGSFEATAWGQFAMLDVDGDGVRDLIFDGASASSILFVVGKQADGTLGFKQSIISPYDSGLARVMAWSVAGVPHVITLGSGGIVRDYTGWPLVQTRQFSVTPVASAGAIGDVDANGIDDLVVLAQDGLHAYAMSDGHAEWDYSASGYNNLALAQLDADPALEIILAGATPGLVLDGATRATDWQYIDGFGARLATGRLAAGGGTQWVSAAAWYQFTVFRATPWSPLWNGTTTQDIGAIATADLDNNGRDVILVGDGQWGAVHVYDTNTHLERFQIPNEGYGIRAIAGGDIDGDAIPDIAFASAGVLQGGPSITVADGQSGLVKWQFFPATGPFTVTALGDVDGDGHEELIAAAQPYGTYGTIAMLDAQSGRTKWTSPEFTGNGNDPFNISVARIALVPHVGRSGMDIVLAGTSGYDGRIIVVDGTNMEVTQQIGAYAAGPLQARGIRGLALFDYDGDNVKDYVIATAPLTTGAQGALLQVISGADGNLLWTSVAMGSNFSGINDVLITDPPAGMPGRELVAVLPDSLRGYNSQTQLLNWTLASTNAGATYIANGLIGPEIVTYSDEGALTFYNATTQAYLRSFATPAPLSALMMLGGNVHQLVVASGNALALVDGGDGSIRATTPYLGDFSMGATQLSASPQGSSVWTVAGGSQAALYRYRLELADRIFASSFEAQ